MKILINSRIFTHICHISDIHIRLYSRKEEYEYVFSKLYESLKKEAHIHESLIVITGDLLHNKNDLTPECIIMTFNFLNELSSICPTVLIAGNHDALLNNKDRLDSITPILYNRNPKNLFYLKDSGHYIFGNIIFTVNSVFDEGWRTSISYQDKINIALYHGQIVGWMNNMGYSSEIGDKTLQDFKNFDLVMLGDIHKFQYMDKEKTMAYSGSLISQNFGETDPHHGYLLWSLSDKTSRFIKIDNPYAFMEGQMIGDRLYLMHYNQEINWKTEELIKKLPRFCNLRIHLSDDKKNNHDFLYRMKEVLPSVKIQKKYYDSTALVRNNTVKNPENRDDSSWIVSFLNDRLKDSQELIDEIIEYYKHNAPNSCQHPSWEILNLKFNDMFGYGKSNEINFTRIQPNSVTGIFGKNSNGKSTLIDIITFLLFGKITRGGNGNVIPKELINNHEKMSNGEIEFMVGSTRYKIHKSIQRQKNDKLKIKEDLYSFEKDRWINHSEEHRKKTDKIVESLIGSMESFLYTNICLQYKEKQFRELTQKERKEFLFDLFGLNCFEKYKKEKDDEIKSLRGEEKVYRDKISGKSFLYWDESIKNKNQDLDQDMINLKKIECKLSELDKDKDTFSKKIKQTRFSSQRDADEFKDSLLKNQEDVDAKIASLGAEKQLLIDLSNSIDIFMIRGIIKNLKEELEGFQEMDCEIYRACIQKSEKEWTSFYHHFKDVLNHSQEIAEEWQQKKNSIDLEMTALQEEDYHYDEKYVKLGEWESIKDKRTKFNLELKNYQDKNMVEVPEIDITTELLIEKMNENYNQYISINCSLLMTRQILEELALIRLNPDCFACVENPQFKKKTRLKNELDEFENRLCHIRKEFFDMIKKLDIQVDQDSSVEEIHLYINNFIKEKRIKRNEELKKKELYAKKINNYQNQIKVYENTRNFLSKREQDKRRNILLQELRTHPAKEKHDELLFFIKNMKIYELVEVNRKKKLKSNEQIRDELNRCLETEEKLLQSSRRLQEINETLLELNKEKNYIDFELTNLEEEISLIRDNQTFLEKKNGIDAEKNSLTRTKNQLNDSILIKKTTLERIKTEYREWKNNFNYLQEITKKIESIRKIIECVDRDGLPLFLLKNYLPIIEADVNDVIRIFLDKKLVFTIIEKDVIIGLEEGGALSNFMGGMESFIFDLTLKMSFSKFARQSRSNFFIIDEGISVFDQDRISNINILLNFLTGISEKTFLISHIPSIKDFVTQSIEIIKDQDRKSRVYCCF